MFTFSFSKNRIIHFLLCMLLILALVLVPCLQSYAIAPVVAIGGAAVLSALLVSMGFMATGASLSSVTNSLLDSLSLDEKNILKVAGASSSVLMSILNPAYLGMAISKIPKSLYESIADKVNNFSPPASINPPVAYDIPEYPIPPDVMDKYNSTPGFKTFCAGPLGALFRYYYIVSSPFPFSIVGDISSPVANVKIERYYVKSSSCVYEGVVTSYTKLFAFFNANFNLNVNGVKTYEALGNVNPYPMNPAYAPSVKPLPVDSFNQVSVTVPYVPLFNGADTNVSIPEGNSIDNPITLEDIIGYYGSIDGYFEMGNAIRLADGTVIGNLSSLTHVPEGELAGSIPTTGSTTIEGDVSAIRSLVNSVSASLASVSSSISDFFRPTSDNTFDLDFDPLKVGIPEKFPFCIPFDFVKLISVFSAQPTDFTFPIQLETTYFNINHTVDLSPFRIPIIFFRYMVILWFSYILLSRTKDMMKW